MCIVKSLKHVRTTERKVGSSQQCPPEARTPTWGLLWLVFARTPLRAFTSTSSAQRPGLVYEAHGRMLGGRAGISQQVRCISWVSVAEGPRLQVGPICTLTVVQLRGLGWLCHFPFLHENWTFAHVHSPFLDVVGVKRYLYI